MTTKQYLRFEPSSVFGVIASSTAKILHIDLNNKCNFVAVPACEDVLLWNLQTKEKVCDWIPFMYFRKQLFPLFVIFERLMFVIFLF